MAWSVTDPESELRMDEVGSRCTEAVSGASDLLAIYNC